MKLIKPVKKYTKISMQMIQLLAGTFDECSGDYLKCSGVYVDCPGTYKSC